MNEMIEVKMIEEYKKSANIKNRLVGTGILDGDTDIEFHFFPDEQKIKLLFPGLNSKMEINISDELIDNFNKLETEQDKYSLINSYVRNLVEDYSIVEGIFIDDGREYMTNGFINVPTFIIESFNHQLATDIIVLTKNNNNKLGIVLIDRKFPPTGWAMAGGMIEDNEDAASNSDKELEEELGSEMKTKKIFTIPENIHTYEVRGYVETNVNVYYSKDAYKKAKAGDDAADSMFLTIEELQHLLETGIFLKKGKRIQLVPHHADILKEYFDNYFVSEEIKKHDSVIKI